MKKSASGPKKTKACEPFQIKNPTWELVLYLLLTIALLVAFLMCHKSDRTNIDADHYYNGYLFLVLSLFSAVGVYACIREKFVYSNGIYRYVRPFGKTKEINVDEIARATFTSVHRRTRYVSTKFTIIVFYDKNETRRMKIADHIGCLSKSELFLKSLKEQGIPITYESDWR